MTFLLNFRNRYILIGDILLMLIAVLGGYVLRLELGAAFIFYFPSALWMMGTAVLIKPIVYFLFGLYRRLWIYASIQEMKVIALAVTTASIIVSLSMVAMFVQGFFVGFPRSVLMIDWLLSLAFVGGLRFSLRLIAENRHTSKAVAREGQLTQVLIVGAGDAGALVAKELQKNPQVGKTPVGFLDDNPSKQNNEIHGVPVIGKVTSITHIIDQYGIDEVIIAIPSAPGSVIRHVTNACRVKGIKSSTMPGLYELLGGKISINRLREVEITDLLRREPSNPDTKLVGSSLRNKTVLVTGAGGSIGQELCKQIARWGPKSLVLLGHGENSIFDTMLELQEIFPNLIIHPVIADIRNYLRLSSVFREFHPGIVFHTAAHKHVPLMELNPEDAVTNNIIGTRCLVDVAIKHAVEKFILISSDKAIRPVNIMGATKRLAEMIVLNAAGQQGQVFSVVRFGNVLGSRGSVVPLFKHQIAKGGPITITHPDMKRYFMTIPEAVNLVLQAAAMGHGGELFMLNMGEQVRIQDLAEDLVRLSGLEPGRDIEIVTTSIRRGEKLSEDLWDEGCKTRATQNPDIFQIEVDHQLSGEALMDAVAELARLADEGDSNTIVKLLDELIPGAAVEATPPASLTSID
ncbi:MAG: polysaccharide biosynthesis protein [Anaerolineaceae bacterium]|nr:polysaccharide biosynthesis protein [Anaerolineaceae bacterium]